MVGHISGVDLSSSDLNVVAQDDFDRAFGVDLNRSVINQSNGLHTNRVNVGFNRTGQVSRSAGLIGGSGYEWHNVYLRQDKEMFDNFTLSLPSVEFANDWYLTTQFTQLNSSPWLDISGFWGEVEQSDITEAVLSYNSEHWVGSLGVMQTKTTLRPGLITGVSDIWACWIEVGWQDTTNYLGIYAGVDPYITDGLVDISLPTSTDTAGEPQYTKESLPLETAFSPYLRVASEFQPINGLKLSLGAIFRDLYGMRMNAEAVYRF